MVTIDFKNRKNYIFGMNIQIITNRLLERGLKQVDIARYVGCSQPTISDISRGKIRNPSFGIGMALLDLARKNHIEVSEPEAS